jgi:hypothetical protein
MACIFKAGAYLQVLMKPFNPPKAAQLEMVSPVKRSGLKHGFFDLGIGNFCEPCLNEVIGDAGFSGQLGQVF